MNKSKRATATIIDGQSTIRIDIDISGIANNNAKRIFETIGMACQGHMPAGSKLESIYFWEEKNENLQINSRSAATI